MKPGLLIAILCLLTLAIAWPGAAAEQNDQPEFTPAQYRWAMRWVNGSLETLMAHGIIESIATDAVKFHLRAGDSWQQLTFRQAGEILKNLSRARQITGHSPFFTVEQGSPGIVLARVSQTSIMLLVPGEGYLDYRPDESDRENTVY